MTTSVVPGLPIERAAGILLHPTSLPGRGIGEIGSVAYRFVDWLAEAGQSFWQILPLVPADGSGSPYNGLSALAGNPLLISLEALVAEGLLDAAELDSIPESTRPGIDFASVHQWKPRLLDLAHRRFLEGRGASLKPEFESFCQAERDWLIDYTRFRALKESFGGASWVDWPAELRDREPAALEEWSASNLQILDRYAFQQFLFARQWKALRQYAHHRGIRVIGDLPIFVAHDSADVWIHRDLFMLDGEGRPTVVAGVPPDYFSETGQRWGNPLYRWDRMRETGYRWWKQRFRKTLQSADVIRIDHFRGFEAYWEIPAEEETAVEGRWVDGPRDAFFHAIQEDLGTLPLIAEDLGIITRGVEELRDRLHLPGMRVLQFAFDGKDDNPHRPDNYIPGCVGYTGTHDNDTLAGWWAGADEVERRRVREWIRIPDPEPMDFLEAVFRSAAGLAVAPLQDVLGLGSEARMNTPGSDQGNWGWKLQNLPTADVAHQLRQITQRTDRI